MTVGYGLGLLVWVVLYGKFDRCDVFDGLTGLTCGKKCQSISRSGATHEKSEKVQKV